MCVWARARCKCSPLLRGMCITHFITVRRLLTNDGGVGVFHFSFFRTANRDETIFSGRGTIRIVKKCSSREPKLSF